MNFVYQPTLLDQFYQKIHSLAGILSTWLVLTNENHEERDSVIRKLWEAHIADNRAQFNKFYEPCHKRLTMFCIGKLRDIELAENAASETLIKLLTQDDPAKILNVDSWIFTVARNHCLTHLSKESGRRNIRESISGSFEKQQRPEAEDNLKLEGLEKVIKDTLSERDYAIWQLHQEGFKNDEISHKMEIPEKTIANRKTEARKLLRIALAKYRS